MFKSLLIVLLVVFSVSAAHFQRYAPSTPGGTYTTPSTNNNNYNTYPSNNNNNSQGPVTVPGVYVNGKPYQYTGPFTLVCYNVAYGNQQPSVYRYNSCYNAYDCASILNDYRNCQGSVKKYAINQ